MTVARKDISYRGPLSYRWLKLIALVAMTVSSAASILLAVGRSAGEESARAVFGAFWNIFPFLEVLGEITFPLLLVCLFSGIIRKRDRIRKTMRVYFIATVLFYLAVILVLPLVVEMMLWILWETLPTIVTDSGDVIRLILDVISRSLQEGNTPAMLVQMLGDKVMTVVNMLGPLEQMIANVKPEMLKNVMANYEPMFAEAVPRLTDTLSKLILTGTGNMSVFLDLFLCSVFYFFACYEPKKLTGGKRLLFRLCSGFPAEYIFLSVVLNGLIKNGILNLPLEVMALLTHRKPAAFFLFLLMIIYIKYREENSLAGGLTAEEHRQLLGTNRESLRLSLFLSAVVAGISLLEFGFSFLPWLKDWGLGTCYGMFLSIPFLLLYSSRRVYRHNWPDRLFALYYIFHYAGILLLYLYITSVMLENLLTVMPAA